MSYCAFCSYGKHISIFEIDKQVPDKSQHKTKWGTAPLSAPKALWQYRDRYLLRGQAHPDA